ncbi:MAG: glycerol dehydratase reactivase beta/small subunit family protein [Clostridiales Family XIII bacterium]|jgi:hypothetical protein|nr:glycerol dehydratase reactivase beta/small subunit family protein [Clostridiales Family XIII bacterium]
METEHERPTIPVGCAGTERTLDFAREVAYGIEEERCVSEIFVLSRAEDIRFGTLGVAVVVLPASGSLHIADLKDDTRYYTVESADPAQYRRLGKNTAKYVKNHHLDADFDGRVVMK